MEKAHEIRKAAIKLFLLNGFKATSMDMIASAVGLKKGSLYHHISSKNDLLYTEFSDAIDDVNASLKNILKSNLPPEKKLKNAIQNHVRKQIEHFDEYRLYLQERKFLPREFEAEYTRKRKTNETFFQKIIGEGNVQGSFRRDLDVRMTTFCLFGMLNWMTQWYKPGGRLSHEEISQHIYDVTMHGIGA